ncbi:MAG: hypothetical protein KJ048_00090 [Dehalococcoidia bacterium]|nr:hypothetical protein [Dehalococcoidia bacterium]
MTHQSTRDEIELFLQGEGIADITLVLVPRDGTAQDIITAAKAHGLTTPDGEALVSIEDADEPLAPNARLDAVGIVHRGRVHVHRCRRVAVSVNFNGDTTGEDFPPSATVGRVKKWAVSKKAFNLQSVDATEHVLQMCNSSTRPDEDVHIGTLVTAPDCRLCFDLVAKQRVEG